ncbi:hypothetical protein DMB65_14730 [Flavobacterium cheongpyeongense]|uniref:Uncharacterized protein n=1 Tax=Flavobacterium cheongpyeongense TaxID=2212651 RepID=A0A2V4BMH8_9FLAO|nr:hypothetical protein [Flavobacterium cheongpyeongense]PXY40041.1 hypothetical protein DMB65_14730 [Flavobacterium cheongpyeongense]
MDNNQQISERKYAANLARKYLSGEISKNEILSKLPNQVKDFKIQLLYNHIIKKPKKSWFFLPSKEKFKKFILEAYEIIEYLESDKLRFKTMKTLFKQLWLESNECNEPIENIGIHIYEVSKITSTPKIEIMRYLNLLIEKNYITKISDQPYLYKFTESGKNIKTDSAIEEIIMTVD